MKYQNINVLVLGGTGFIGSRLAERLKIEEGANVRVLVHTWKNATWVSRSDIELVEGDITSKESLKYVLKDVKIVFHCVGIGGDSDTINRTNIKGLKNLLEIIQEENLQIKLIFLSSIAVFGPQPKSNIESTGLYDYTVHNNYARSKIESEQLIISYANNKIDLPFVIIRPTYVWGPNSDYFTIAPIVQIKNNSFTLINEGQGIANAVYIDNLVDAILEAGVNEHANNNSFIITDDSNYTWGEFFSYYASFFPNKIKIKNIRYNSEKRSLNNVKLAFFKDISKIIREVQKISNNLIRNYSKINRISNFIFAKLDNLFLKLLVFDEWEAKKYSNPNKIEILKAKTLLNYSPRFNLNEGMEHTKKWLEIQNYLEN